MHSSQEFSTPTALELLLFEIFSLVNRPEFVNVLHFDPGVAKVENGEPKTSKFLETAGQELAILISDRCRWGFEFSPNRYSSVSYETWVTNPIARLVKYATVFVPPEPDIH